MNKNNKIIIISMVAIAISALASIMLLNKFTLKKPVFLMNYREIGVYEDAGRYSIQGNNFFSLNYISDVQDTRKINNITFKEIPNTEFTVFSDTGQFNQSKDGSGRYKMNSVQLICYDLKDMSGINEKMVTKADIEFDDGLTLEVDLGKIIFFAEDIEKGNIERISGGSSSDGTAYSTFRANEDVRIEKIETSLDHDINDLFSFNISSVVYDEEKGTYINQEENLKKDSIITFKSEYRNNDLLKKYTIYDIEPKIYFINNENLRYAVRCNNISNKNKNHDSESNLEIYMYLKARGEL